MAIHNMHDNCDVTKLFKVEQKYMIRTQKLRLPFICIKSCNMMEITHTMNCYTEQFTQQKHALCEF